MPITQDRLITLLSACDELQKYITSLQSHARSLDHDYKSGAVALETVYEILQNRIQRNANLPMDALLAIERERAHFRSSAKRNTLVKEYLRRQRAGESTLDLTAPEAAINEKIPRKNPNEGIELSQEFLESMRLEKE